MCFTARSRREARAAERTQDDVWRAFERDRKEPGREPTTPILEERDERETEAPERAPLTTAR